MLLLNGFDRRDQAMEHEQAMGDLEHESVFCSPPTLDLPAYASVAERLDTDRICFLNSHSTLLSAGWLAALEAQLAASRRGAVGATGSYESPSSRNPLSRRRWARFPNPHLRTNAFMLSRDLMRTLYWPEVRSKSQAWLLESGLQGLSRQIWDRGGSTLVVGRDGAAYPPGRWPISATFRSGGQANLLIADNRTRQWEEADPAERAQLSRLAWGDDPATSAARVTAETADAAPGAPQTATAPRPARGKAPR